MRPSHLGLVLACALGLAACASTPTPPATVICPPLKTYSADVQKRLADELRALPEGTETQAFLSDYAALRASIRVCGAAK